MTTSKCTKNRKVATTVVHYLMLILCIMLFCAGCTGQNEVQKAADLVGTTIELGNTVTVSFDNIEETPVKLEFYICPTDKKIVVDYVEGSWSGLTINLYNSLQDEMIQTGTIQDKGGRLTFSNLTGKDTYYLDVCGIGDGKEKPVHLQFTK